jgi:hypothetical protein
VIFADLILRSMRAQHACVSKDGPELRSLAILRDA